MKLVSKVAEYDGTVSLPAWGVWIEMQRACTEPCFHAASLPAWGVWIEIGWICSTRAAQKSLPAWGVWIEMFCAILENGLLFCRSPHGECGLKFQHRGFVQAFHVGRSPHGECGLKFIDLANTVDSLQSLPAWGVWIEIEICTISEV